MSEAAWEAFPTTIWTLIDRAADSDPASRRQALEELMQRYWGPMRAYLLASGFRPTEADDLVQGFITSRMLDQEFFGRVGSARGRFRTYIVTCLKNYVQNCARSERTDRRGGGERILSLSHACEPPDCASDPATVLDVAWARQVLSEAVERMRAECHRLKRPALWEIFELRVLRPALEGTPPKPYAEIVTYLNLESPTQASNLLVTAKRMFARSLRQIVSGYESTDTEIEHEIGELQRILRGSP